MLRTSAAALLLAACSFDPSVAFENRDADRADTIDAGSQDGDVTPIAADASPPPGECVGDLFAFDLLNLERCDPADPDGSLQLTTIGDYELNTDTGLLTHGSEAPHLDARDRAAGRRLGPLRDDLHRL